MNAPTSTKVVPYALLVIVVLLVSACGRDNAAAPAADSSAPSGSAEQAAVPTMPAAAFTAVAQTSELVTRSRTVTETAVITAPVTDTAAAADLERGALAYERNLCGDCHGAQGEGVAGKGSPIAGTLLTLDEFDTVLRTGAGLGNTHIFGRSAISPTGMEALYSYVQSFQ
jgi:mono/diheme cytochrome c family protein